MTIEELKKAWNAPIPDDLCDRILLKADRAFAITLFLPLLAVAEAAKNVMIAGESLEYSSRRFYEDEYDREVDTLRTALAEFDKARSQA